MNIKYIIGLFILIINNSYANNMQIEQNLSLTLAKKNACLGCHAIDRKVVGPSFSDIAKRYNYTQDPIIIQALSYKVQKGGGGSWGVVPMPANAINSQDAKAIISWIMTIKNKK